jgi:hypothetical protein
LLKDFIEKLIVKLIQKSIKVLSNGIGFANQYKFSHKKKFKRQKFNQEKIEI